MSKHGFTLIELIIIIVIMGILVSIFIPQLNRSLEGQEKNTILIWQDGTRDTVSFHKSMDSQYLGDFGRDGVRVKVPVGSVRMVVEYKQPEKGK